MKKYIIGLMAILAINSSYAQNVQASLGLAGNPTNVRIYLRPNVTQTAVFSSLQFTIALPSSITPTPTLSVISTAFGAAPAGSWIVDPPYVENGFIVYPIYTSASGFSLPVTMNTEFQAMEVSFSGGPAGNFVNSAHLICLPDGGLSGNNAAYFFCSGTLNSSGSSLFYARDGTVTATNGFSYNESNPGTPPGNFTSFARLSSAITLPVRFASFTASKIDNNGLLNWMVENQTTNISHYEVERSFTGTGADFTRIGRKDPVTNGIYNFTDAGVFNSYSGNVYYRIKQTDRNGDVSYSPVRLIRADGKGIGLSLYPNPVVKEANIIFTVSEASPVSLVISDAAGKQYTSINMQAAKGMNQKNIDVSALPAGTYNVRIVTNDETQTLSFVKSN